MVSAHWYTNATAVTAMPRPRTIHDFYGFPQEMFDVHYPAPGAPELAEEVADLAGRRGSAATSTAGGSTTAPGRCSLHAFPDASIPVVQLSLNAFQGFDYHLELGRRLRPLRDAGVLVIGSGNVVHNLRAVDYPHVGRGVRLGAPLRRSRARQMLEEHARPTWRPSTPIPTSAGAVPTPDHFLPLLYIAGLADDEPFDFWSTVTRPARSRWPPTPSGWTATPAACPTRGRPPHCPRTFRRWRATSETALHRPSRSLARLGAWVWSALNQHRRKLTPRSSSAG